MLQIDGSFGEGGGQIIRTALGLSMLTSVSFELVDIRKGRPNPGLQTQHINCVEAALQLCNGRCEGVLKGSETLRFFPWHMQAKPLAVSMETAGSITLFLQSLLLPSCFLNKKQRIEVTGGTDVAWSIPFDYLQSVLLFYLKEYADFDIALEKRGFYPRGGGKVSVSIKPKIARADFHNFLEFFSYLKKTQQPISYVERGELLHIKGVAFASKDLLEKDVAERIARSAQHVLKKYGVPVTIQQEYVMAQDTGAGITVWAYFAGKKSTLLGADTLSEKGMPAEQVGKEAAEALCQEIDSGAVVDKHVADNLIPFLGLFGGEIKTSEITHHTRTNISVVEQFLGVTFKIDEENKIIVC